MISDSRHNDPPSPEPMSSLEADATDEDVAFRQEALRWIHEALSDLDRAIQVGRNDTAKLLLHRIQDVLYAPATRSDSKE